ncbi:hypothetical protein QBC44DRAFT_366744 [Cladorrhinum sp. PSN332]|nr:hypothetical protein QBC44DRAFT_366744 [Cladorrhinum sp. PSN332]
MAYSSDEDDRGRHHPNYRTGRHRSRRERSRPHDYRDHRGGLETIDKEEEDSSGSSVRSRSGTRDNERAISQHHHQHSRSDGSRNRNSKSSKRGRSMIKHGEPVTHIHTRHSHSAEPSRNHGRHWSRAQSRSAKEINSLNGRLAEKAVGTAATVAFRLRNSEGSWVGKRGLKVVGATVATTAIDAVFDRHPKEHALRHIAISMVEGAVMDVFATSSPLGS